jgi:hypothetical protein
MAGKKVSYNPGLVPVKGQGEGGGGVGENRGLVSLTFMWRK